MSVQFILGRSGTGKTSFCIKAIVEALAESSEQPLLLLVPEQATYQAERAILADSKVAGYSRLNVLSFDRLQFLLLGKNTARPAISRTGRQMIVHRILRDNRDKLKIFDSSATRPGLARQMAETIAELHQYAKTPDDIDQLLSKLQKFQKRQKLRFGDHQRNKTDNLTALKFADISLVFNEYQKFIETRFIDPDIQLTRACRQVQKAAFVKGAKLWVDGFAGFAAAEFAMLTELLKAAADTQIALCLDPSNPNPEHIEPTSLFYPTQRSYAALVELIKKCKLQLAKPVILKQTVRFSHCRPLAHIERNIFEFQAPKIAASDNIRIISAPNERCEAQFVARQIMQLVKQKDYRYRDIAVIASDIDIYQHYIRAYFDDYGIPFFIDKRKPLNQHPVVQLICSALQAVTGGFFGRDVFAYLKTDLVPIQRSDVDLLENYCLAFGVNSSDWLNDDDWNFAGKNSQFDQRRVNQIRRSISDSLLRLRDGLCPADNPVKTITAAKFTQIIFDFLDSLGVREKTARWVDEALDKKDYAAADEHRQFYEKLVSIFDELVEVFAGHQMTCSDFAAIVNSAFSQLTLAFIPPRLDQVLVGSIERSRHPDLKAVFLIGATQKQFPSPLNSSGILTDDDRLAAESADFALSPTSLQSLAERQYLAYIAFTRPSQFLCITYPLADGRQADSARSQFIAGLEALFENLTEESIANEQIEIDKIHTETELACFLCSRLGKDADKESRLGGLLNDICADGQLAELGLAVASAINYDNRPHIDKAIVKRLFGRRIRSSATRLSTFAACPYQYFARYILKLKKREEFKLRPLDVGNFYHRVLDSLIKQLAAEKKDIATIQDQQLLNLLREQISSFVQTDSFIRNFARRSTHNEFIIHSACDVLEDCVLAIAQMVRAGSFKPTLSEVSFGGDEDTLGEYRVALSNNRMLLLNGKIDRLDTADIDSGKQAIVFDYKRRGKSFSWSKFFYGLDMQLAIYLLAVRNTTGSEAKNAVGAFYMPVEVGIEKAAPGKLPQQTGKFYHKARGIFNGRFTELLDATASKESRFYNFNVTKDGQPYGNYENRGALKPSDFEKMLQFTECKIAQLAEEILSGKIDVAPYRLSGQSPCSYCDYKSVCRFDWQINDYNFLRPIAKSKALEKMGAADG